MSDYNEEIYADRMSDKFSETDYSNSSEDEISMDSDLEAEPFEMLQIPSFSDSDPEEEVSENSDSTKDDIMPKLHNFKGESGLQTILSENSISTMTELFIGDDFIQLLVTETNRYYTQNSSTYKKHKSKPWGNITLSEMKKFMGLIIVMGYVRKPDKDDYWSLDALIATPLFSEIMSRNRFRDIWKYWHFNNNENMTQNRLGKIENVLTYFVQKFQTIYKPKKELFLNDSIIPWRGKLMSQSYNPTKITKYGILVRTVCEAQSGYICNLKMYCGEDAKSQDALLPVLHPFLGLWHDVYVDSYYNSRLVAEEMLEKETRVCGTLQKNRGIPECLKSVTLKKEETKFCRKNDILIQAWRPKQKVIYMMSSIHSAKIIGTGKKDRKTNKEIRKPACIVDYNKYVKSMDRADQHMSYYSILKKTKKWTKKAVLYLLNCALFNAYKLYKENANNKMPYKKFLLSVARNWLVPENKISTQADEPESSSSMTSTKRAPKYDPPTRLSLDMSTHNISKIVGKGKAQKCRRPCRVCTANKKRSSTMYMCINCGVPLHAGTCFAKYHTSVQY